VSSPGELEMTPSICRGPLLQRLTQLVRQARVLDGDNGLIGEIPNQRDLLVGERPHFLAVDTMAPISSFSLSIGTIRSVRTPPSLAERMGTCSAAASMMWIIFFVCKRRSRAAPASGKNRPRDNRKSAYAGGRLSMAAEWNAS
jgi:ethanolamine ammonia-lyase small subunit